jgi:hypothetical protein
VGAGLEVFDTINNWSKATDAAVTGNQSYEHHCLWTLASSCFRVPDMVDGNGLTGLGTPAASTVSTKRTNASCVIQPQSNIKVHARGDTFRLTNLV